MGHATKSRQGRRTHTLCWRICRHEMGMCGFERQKLAHQGIVLRVGHDGCIVHIVGLIVSFDLTAQRSQTLDDRVLRIHTHAPALSKDTSCTGTACGKARFFKLRIQSL